MTIVKYCVDFVVRHVLRRRRSEDSNGETLVSVDHSEPTITVRTFPPGGDPFDDRIEFFLGKSSGVDGGFRDPR